MNLFWDQEVPYIDLFSLDYLFYLALMAGLLLLLFKNVKWIISHNERLRIGLLIISIGQQILLYSWYILEMGFDMGESLPLHISRISSILGILYLITKRKTFMDVLFYFGLFAYGSFFYPARVYPVYHVMGISFFVNHAITILLPVLMMIVSDWRPTYKAAKQSYLYFLVYFFFVYLLNPLNPLIDGNYFYLKHRPFFGNLPDSIYVPGVLILTYFIFLLGYYLSLYLNKRLSILYNKKMP